MAGYSMWDQMGEGSAPGGGSLWGGGLPWLGASAATGLVGGLVGHGAAKRDAKKRDMLWKGMLGSVDLGASQARQDVAEQSGQAASGLRNSLAERGLTGSTAYDAANNAILAGRGKAMGAINARQAQDRNQLLGMAPGPGPSKAGLWEGLAGVAGNAGVLSQQNLMADRLTRAMLNGQGAQSQLQGGGSVWDWFRG